MLGGRLFADMRVANRAIEAFRRMAPADAALAWFGDSLPPDARAAIDRDIAAIDRLIGAQVDAILHHPRVQALEGSWRALFWLVDRPNVWTRDGDHLFDWHLVRFRVLDIDWNEIARDVTRAIEFDQSELFRKIYEEEFGRAGGEPFGLMVVDHAVTHGTSPGATIDDVTVLEQLRGIAAAAFTPMIFSAAPSLLDLDGFEDLWRLPDIGALFSGRRHQRWASLTSRRDSEFLAVTLPRILVRPPWRDDDRHPCPFHYDEATPTAAERCWASAGYAFGAAAARAFAAFNWPADVRGSEIGRQGGGLVNDLPVEWFTTDPVGVWPRLPIEVVLTDAQERQLVEAGLMPVSAPPHGHELLFGVVRSLRRPERHQGAGAAQADASARLSSQVNSVLCVSRFAHYLKVLTREKLGSVTTADGIERELGEWLNGYVNGSQSDDPTLRARYPLVAGRVEVREIPGMPGSFTCNIHLQPHFQLDDVGATFSLVTEVTPNAA